MTEKEWITDESQVTLPFSLACEFCTNGEQVASFTQAVAEGWTCITEEDGAFFNYVGCCPDCQRDATNWDMMPPQGAGTDGAFL